MQAVIHNRIWAREKMGQDKFITTGKQAAKINRKVYISFAYEIQYIIA